MPRSPGPTRRQLLAGAATAIAAGGSIPPPAAGVPSRAARPEDRPVGPLRARLRRVVRRVRPEWGERNGVTVEIDHLVARASCGRAPTPRSPPSRATTSSRSPSPPAAYEAHVTPLTDVVTECERRFGRLLGFAQKGTFSPRRQAVLRRPGELGRRAAPLPERSLGRRRGRSPTPGSSSARAPGRSARSAGCPPGSASRPSPTAT